MSAHDLARDAELDLLTSSTRKDPAHVASLLHPEFVEIGRSGRRFTRDDIIAGLAAEPARETPGTDEWHAADVGPGLVLLTYRVTAGGRASRHSSLWDVSTPTPRLRFHQGTFVA